MPIKSKFFICFLISFFSQTSFCQLADFNLKVTVINETCSGNGTLTFETTGTTTGSSIFYTIYLLPDVTTPVSIVNISTLTGLTAGNYRVVALQTLGDLSNSSQQDVVIVNQVAPIEVVISGQPINCVNGNITVSVIQGIVVQFEILSGPITVMPQASNVFTNIPIGQYVIRVFDNCGNAYVETFTLLGVSLLNLDVLTLGCTLIDCETATVNFDISAGDDFVISYPLNITLTLEPFPPNGMPVITLNQIITSGFEDLMNVNFDVPFTDGQDYNYNIVVTDACGGTFTESNVIELLSSSTITQSDTVPINLEINTCNMLPPYTVTFIESPVGFDPANFNSNHPGPFTSTPILYSSTSTNNIPFGNYDVIVTDACGRTSTCNCQADCQIFYTLEPVCSTFGLFEISNDCGDITSVIFVSAPAEFNQILPFDASSLIVNGKFKTQLPVGSYIITGLNQFGDDFEFIFTIALPVFRATVTDIVGCESPNSGIISIDFDITQGPYLPIFIGSVFIINAPPTYEFPLPNDVSDSIIEIFDNDNPQVVVATRVKIENLPIGDYTIQIIDICGNSYNVNATITQSLFQDLPIVSIKEGCEIGEGSMSIMVPLASNTSLETVIMTAAPSTYTQSMPYDVSFNIQASNGVFYMNSLPNGAYTFNTKDKCGVEHTFPVEITNGFFDTNVFVQGNCGSFNLFLNHIIAPDPSLVFFILHKLNPITNEWINPFNGVVFQDGAFPNIINSYFLSNSNFNITTEGHFRILKLSYNFSNGNASLIPCVQEFTEFDFNGILKITAAFKLSCENNNNQVIILAGDTFPLNYKITTKDGLPFLVDNLTSNIFNGLTSGIYNFQVSDVCGNIANRLVDLTSLSEPTITASILCDNQRGTLSVPPFAFLSYQWWKGSDTTTILSTTNQLNFAPFSQLSTPGTYYVRIYSETPLSCYDKIITYIIPSISNPNAGEDATINICNSFPINLFTYLNGTFDSNGTWNEITNSGSLSQNIWLPIGIVSGVYKFVYTVNGFCDDIDEAIVTINFNETIPNPIVTVDPIFCAGESIQFNVNTVSNAGYIWSGPNNFSSNIQNPFIENATVLNSGVYTIKILRNDCEVASIVDLIVNPAPNFQITESCNNNNLSLLVIPVLNSFDQDEVNYLWTGPDGYTSSSNPAVINSGKKGTYNVTVTALNGCSVNSSIVIQNALCGDIQTGISPNGDTKNQNFDLTGYDVLKFKIFSRYGNIVYEQDNYTNQWYGQDFNDRELPDATYFYYIRMKSGEEKTGWVYVTR